MALLKQLMRIPAISQLAPTVSSRTFASSAEKRQVEHNGSKTQHDPETKKQATIPKVAGWKEEHASESETAVKADRHHDGETIEQLQDHTVKVVKARHGESKE